MTMSVTRQDAAAEADREGRLPDATYTRLVEDGFARWFVPTDRGGDERSFEDLLEAVSSLGEDCTSTAWIASLTAFGGRYVRCLSPQAQQDVWAGGPDARVVASIKPQGRLQQVDGDIVLDGVWSYVSGVEQSDWALLSTPGGPPGAGPAPIMALVPRSDYSIVEDWSSFGMRATGSHSLRLDAVRVPSHRTAPRGPVMAGVPWGRPDLPAVPSTAVNGITFVAPALGAARAALRDVLPALAGPVTGPRALSVPSYQVEHARASAEVDAAALLLHRLAVGADAGRADPATVARSRRDATYALEVLVTALDRCLRVSGTRGTSRGTSSERRWRDVHSIASHAVMQFEPAAVEHTVLLTQEPA